MAADVTVPNTIVNGTANDAGPVMANFNAILTWLNTNAVHIDAAKATTSVLSGPNSDPSSANQYTRKSYVDTLVSTSVAAEAALRVAGDARMGATATRAAVQSIPNGAVLTAISFDTETNDTSTFFAPTSTNVTVPASSAGVYVIRGTVSWASGPTSGGCAISVNGTVMAQSAIPSGGVSTTICGTAACVLLAVGDVVTFGAIHSSGAAINVTGSLAVYRVSV